MCTKVDHSYTKKSVFGSVRVLNNIKLHNCAFGKLFNIARITRKLFLKKVIFFTDMAT